ncbi:MAG TPA: aldo/keto reductase [Bacteroidia bacterium]|jgi:voltage-dependent potassium channel beta subunit|nr:aldo/keto reductase [Bacteroidia bacterium]HQF27154.1 aldo/keto reductase [Bacteroidia bacterium]HQK96666.1 aldo/keto reductase [Bacteroidia bacterium]
MEYRKFGNTGIQISALSLGSWLTFGKQINNSLAEELMIKAYDNGINFFDNAETYARGKSEEVMGNILHSLKWSRSSFMVSSKVYFGYEDNKPNQRGLSRKHIIEGCEAALKRLQVDYIDLFFCHRPDKNTPILETVQAMNTLIQQGKILYWGTSEWSAQEILQAHLEAERHHLIAPVMEQPQYNMLERKKMEDDYLHIFRYQGMGTTIWSPLASGILSGKYLNENPADTRLAIEGLEWLRDRNLTEERLNKVKAIKAIADQLNVSMPQLAIAWCLKNDHVSTVILGASKVKQLEENLGAINILPKVTADIMLQIDEVLSNKPVIPEF